MDFNQFVDTMTLIDNLIFNLTYFGNCKKHELTNSFLFLKHSLGLNIDIDELLEKDAIIIMKQVKNYKKIIINNYKKENNL